VKKIPNIIIWALAFGLAVGIVEASDLTETSDKDGIVEYIEDYLRIYPTRRKISVALVPYLVEVSREHDVDPWLTAVTISGESSWRQDVKGSKGELGMTQVHGFCAKGANLKTGKGQILAGVKCLEHAKKKCSDTLSVINAYKTGRCSPIDRASRYRFREYKKAKRRFGK
jgi:hypothetical protein